MRTDIRDIVLRANILIEVTPKNRIQQLKNQALGQIEMAYFLGAMTEPEYYAARSLIRTTAAWRDAQNSPNMEQWLDEKQKAARHFKEICE